MGHWQSKQTLCQTWFTSVSDVVYLIFTLLNVLHYALYLISYIVLGSWKGRRNHYIELVRVLNCKLLTNSKQLPTWGQGRIRNTDRRGGNQVCYHCATLAPLYQLLVCFLKALAHIRGAVRRGTIFTAYWADAFSLPCTFGRFSQQFSVYWHDILTRIKVNRIVKIIINVIKKLIPHNTLPHPPTLTCI